MPATPPADRLAQPIATLILRAEPRGVRMSRRRRHVRALRAGHRVGAAAAAAAAGGGCAEVVWAQRLRADASALGRDRIAMETPHGAASRRARQQCLRLLARALEGVVAALVGDGSGSIRARRSRGWASSALRRC